MEKIEVKKAELDKAFDKLLLSFYGSQFDLFLKYIKVESEYKMLSLDQFMVAHERK